MAKINNKELLKIAQNTETTPEELWKVWHNSKSIKVRKAVASNPNADHTVLRAAARLYIEEVLENPGFEMLRLFDDDPWIVKLGEAYDNPLEYVRKNRFVGFYSSTGHMDFLRAALISPKCDAGTISFALEAMPATQLKRIFKNELTKARVAKTMADTYESNAVMFGMEGIFKAWMSDLIDTETLYHYIAVSGSISSMSCRKSVYTKVFRTLLNTYDSTEDDSAARALSTILIVSRSTCINWIKYFISEKHLEIIANSVKIAKATLKRWDKYSNNGARGVRSYANSSVKCLTGIIAEILWDRWDYDNKAKRLGLVYKKICQIGLENHEWGDSKHTSWPMILNRELCECLDKEDIRIKAFYARAGCLGKWFNVMNSDVKYRILNEANEWLYGRGGVENIIFNSISLKKIISISDDVFIA